MLKLGCFLKAHRQIQTPPTDIVIWVEISGQLHLMRFVKKEIKPVYTTWSVDWIANTNGFADACELARHSRRRFFFLKIQGYFYSGCALGIKLLVSIRTPRRQASSDTL